MRKLLSLLMIPTLMGLTGFPQSVQAKTRGAAEIEAGDPLVVQAPRGLNVRKKPNAQRIGAIPDGQMIFATGPAKKHKTGRAGLQYWLPIRYQNESNEWVNGWIYLRHTARTEAEDTAAEETTGKPAEVVNNKEETVDGPQEALEQQPAAATEVVDTTQPMRLNVSVNSRARFRASPSLSGRILGRLKNDTSVDVIGRPRGEWIPIRVPSTGETGWMHVSLLEAEGKLNPLELADRHEDAGAKVDDLIAAFEKTLPTEAGHVETCTDCNGGGSGQNLEQIPAGSGKAYIYPVNGPIRSRFGTRKDPITGRRKGHGGVDFGVGSGTSVGAIRGGKVVAVKTSCRIGNRKCGGGWGNYVIIDHGNGVKSVYAHLKSVNVRIGTRVSQGQTIAKSGTTGRSTGPHLHLELHVNGKKVDPLRYLQK